MKTCERTPELKWQIKTGVIFKKKIGRHFKETEN